MAGLKSGGALTGGAPSGSSMAVDANGNCYRQRDVWKGDSGVRAGRRSPTTLGQFQNFNPGGVAIDPAGNLYLSNTYNGTIIKVPVVERDVCGDSRAGWHPAGVYGQRYGRVRHADHAASLRRRGDDL